MGLTRRFFIREITSHRKVWAAFSLLVLWALMLFALIRFREALLWLGSWGYLGIFLAELVTNASLLIPIPGRAYLLIQAAGLNPLLAGLAAGLGATLGELSGYYAGAKGLRFLEKTRFNLWLQKALEGRAGTVLFVMAVLPVPFDVAGLWAGAIRYPLGRFFLYVAPGKILKMITLTLAARYGLAWLLGPMA